MSDGFNVVHLHSMLSLLDSCTSYKDYIDRAKEIGQTAICFTEHGNIYNHISKQRYCKKNGIKYLHGVEVYLTRTHEEKARDNYHTVLVAKNSDGVKELNLLVGNSTKPDSFYYKPRISFDEFLATSDNIISYSACLQSPLNRLDESEEYYEPLIKKYTFLEVQPHVNSDDQKSFNKRLIQLAKKYHKPLIATNDVHSINSYKGECRKVLQKAKGIHFKDDTLGAENAFDLTFKSHDEMVELFRKQGVLSEGEIEEALHNTIVLADMCDDLALDTSFKYPKISDNDEKLLMDLINKKYKEKCASGVIAGGKEYLDKIREEFRVFKKLNMLTFMLFMSNLICWCREKGIPIGPSRGSVAGSEIAFIIDITEVDPVVWGTIFSRFANEDRLETGDIDIDLPTDSRDMVYSHIFGEFGYDLVAYVLAIGTISDKGTIDEIGRALGYPLDDVSKIKNEYENDPEKAKGKYPDLFYYFDGLVNTAISQSIHPAGIVVSPVTLPDNYGVFWKDGQPIMQIDMEDIHDCGLNKYDLLGLKTVNIIRDCCSDAGIPYLKPYEVDFHDDEVWKDVKCSRVGMFEFEKPNAHKMLCDFGVKSVEDLSLINAAIRPSGATYRDKLIKREFNKNPSEKIDKLLEDSLGYIVYQEQITAFLQELCGYSGSQADNCRRMIARKHPEEINAELPKISSGYCDNSSKERDVAEEEVKQFVKVIEDASAYAFGKNHSTGYSILSYYCAYLRYYYPGEFIAAYLNNANNQEDIQDGTELSAIKGVQIEPPKFRMSVDKYVYSPESKTIYKGLASIKYLNKDVADTFYSLRHHEFKSFTDLLVYVMENTSVDTRQMRILITIDFFSEFGQNGKLLDIYSIFCDRYKKTYVDKTKVKRIGEVMDVENSARDYKIPIAEQIDFEKENVGYISCRLDCDKRYCYVEGLNTKFTPRVKLYSFSTGRSITCKLDKKFWQKNKFKEKDIIFAKKFMKKPKWIKTDDGFKKTGEMENACVEWRIVDPNKFSRNFG